MRHAAVAWVSTVAASVASIQAGDSQELTRGAVVGVCLPGPVTEPCCERGLTVQAGDH